MNEKRPLPTLSKFSVPIEVFFGIKKQYHPDLIAVINVVGTCTYNVATPLTKNQFDDWWDKEILPLFENAQVVYGCNDGFFGPPNYLGPQDEKHDNHQALVIKIERLKEEKEGVQPQYIDSGVELNGDKLYKKVVEK